MEIHAVLEIGTTNTVLAIGEKSRNGELTATSVASIPSSGIYKSQILDITKAAHSIRSVLRSSQKIQEGKGGVIDIGEVYLLVTGQHIQVYPYQGSAQISNGKVSEDDINDCQQSARMLKLPKGRELLDIIEQSYGVDDRFGITDPKGMSGSLLRLNTLQIHADANRINDARSAAEREHIEIKEPLFCVTRAADAVLDEADKRDGALVLDFGGGSTGYAAYIGGQLVTCGVIGVGGDHITNDIATAFQTTQAQAVDLKIVEASAVLTGDDSNSRVNIVGDSPLMYGRTISRRGLNIVVNARMKELLGIIRNDICQNGLWNKLRSGIILTGGGAALRGLDQLVQQELCASVRYGKIRGIVGFDQYEHSERFAAVAGALLYAAHSEEPGTSILSTLFRGLFK